MFIISPLYEIGAASLTVNMQQFPVFENHLLVGLCVVQLFAEEKLHFFATNQPTLSTLRPAWNTSQMEQFVFRFLRSFPCSPLTELMVICILHFVFPFRQLEKKFLNFSSNM